jgi:hypothetical protein
MINREETEAFFNNQEKELAESKRKHEAFIKDLEEELLMLPFSYLPHIGEYRDRFITTLIKEAHLWVIDINENLEHHLYSRVKNKDENIPNWKTPQRSDYPSEKAEIEEAIISLPFKDEESVNDMTECAMSEREQREFLFLCHDKAKELIYKHFPEITELSGNAIRDINHTAYQAANLYKKAFYYLTINYR